MISNTIIDHVLFLPVIVAGFYGGTGFFTAMGGNPALKKMSDRTFAEYWQHTDYYMASRMKIFGPFMLCMMLLGVLVLLKDYRSLSFWCMLAAFCVLLADLVFTFFTNHPLNKLVQSWRLDHLPPNVREIKWEIARAFEVRSVFMISSFLLVLLAVWLRKSS